MTKNRVAQQTTKAKTVDLDLLTLCYPRLKKNKPIVGLTPLEVDLLLALFKTARTPELKASFVRVLDDYGIFQPGWDGFGVMACLSRRGLPWS